MSPKWSRSPVYGGESHPALEWLLRSVPVEKVMSTPLVSVEAESSARTRADACCADVETIVVSYPLISTARRLPIQIEARGLRLTAGLRGGAARRLARVLAALEVGVMRARLVFSDDNGPKGGRACRCALTLALSRRQTIHVEHTAPSSTLAFDGALGRLEHRLARVRGVARDSRRRPKKYDVARRA